MAKHRRHRPEPVDRDTYRRGKSLPDGVHCSDCGLVVSRGRWTRPEEGAGRGDTPDRCPACQRVRDDYPAGTIEITGDLGRLAPELEGLARNVEAAESAEHPLERIMHLEVDERRLVASTTGVHLARRIGRALERRLGDRVRLRYGEEEALLRVVGEV